MTTKEIDYLTILGYIQTLNIPVYDLENDIDCNFNIDDRVGQGSALDVYKAYLRRPGKERLLVALKLPNVAIKGKARDSVIYQMLNDIRQELRMMKHFEKHPNVVDLYGVAFKDLKLALVVEYAVDTLTDYLIERKDDGNPVDWSVKEKFCCDIANGLHALHLANIVHGDVKGDNILLFAGPCEDEELTAKISDFGYSSTAASIKRGGGTGGTPRYFAPECTQSADANFKAFDNLSTKDNYSYGLVVWHIAANGEEPYDGMDGMQIDQVKNTDKELHELLDQLGAEVPEKFKALIIAMTCYDPNDRASLTSVRGMMIDMAEAEVDKAGYAKAKEAFEKNAKGIEAGVENLNGDVEKAELNSLQLMSIPPSVKARIFRGYEAAAAKVDSRSASLLSMCFGIGFGIERDLDKMAFWAIKAAELGSLDGVMALASIIRASNLPGDPVLLFPWLLKAAEAGHRASQICVGYCYFEGIGVENNSSVGREWMIRSLGPAQDSERELIFESSLHRAGREGNVGAIRFVMRQGSTKVDAKDGFHRTPLHLAAKHGHIETIKVLAREFGADVNLGDMYSHTALHWAAYGGHSETVKFLVKELGMNINEKSKFGSTMLHRAAEGGHIETVKILVKEFGMDVNAGSGFCKTALQLAARRGHTETVKILVTEFGMDVNAKDEIGRTVLHDASRYGHTETVKILVKEFGMDVNAKDEIGGTALHLAARGGHMETVRILVKEFGIDVNVKNKYGNTALHLAAVGGHMETVKILVKEFGMDVNAKDEIGSTALHLAARGGHMETVRILVKEFGIDVNVKNKYGNTALHLAAVGGHMETVEILVKEFGMDVNAKDEIGRTALHLAARHGHTETVKILVKEFSIDINVTQKYGGTALHDASSYGHTETVKILIREFGMDVNAKNKLGNTALHLAAEDGHTETVRILVKEFGMNVNAKNELGSTALHLAARGGQTETVRILVKEFGMVVNAKNRFGETALILAEHFGCMEVVEFLLNESDADTREASEAPRRFIRPS